MPPRDLFELFMCCTLCSKRFAWKPGNGTGSLKQHLESQHATAFRKHEDGLTAAASAAAAAAAAAEPQEDVKSIASSSSAGKKRHAEWPAVASSVVSTLSISSNSSSSSSNNKKARVGSGPLDRMFAAQSSDGEHLTKKAVVAFASNRISFRVVEDSEFQALCEAVRSSQAALPSRKAMKSATLALEASMRTDLLRRFVQSRAPVAIAFDGWTNVKQAKVTNVVVICDGVAFYWRSITNASEKNTAEWMERSMVPVIEELLQAGVRLVGLVADNESVNGALFALLAAKYVFLLRIPCAAHTIQLVVKSSFASVRWKKMREEVERLLKEFSLKECRQQLLNLQQAAGNSPLFLLKPNDTRWNSFLFACQRLLKLRDFVNVIARRPDEFWSELEALVDFLLPFQVATDVLQRDSATLFDVWQQYNLLAAHVKANARGEEKAVALTALRSRWNRQVNADATIAVAILSFVDTAGFNQERDLDPARDFIVDFGEKYLRKFNKSTLSADQLKAALLAQYGHLTNRSSRFCQLEEHIRSTQLSDGAQWRALTVWGLYVGMELGQVATALLTLPSSEAAVERTFSAQDAIHTKKRNRLQDSTVQASMFVAFNTRGAMKSTSLHVHKEIEMTLDFLDTDDERPEDEQDEHPQPPLQEEDEEDAEEQKEPMPVEELRRTYSEIHAGTKEFLELYIKQRRITTKWKWTCDRTNDLETEAREFNKGGPTVMELQAQIRSILHNASL